MLFDIGTFKSKNFLHFVASFSVKNPSEIINLSVITQVILWILDKVRCISILEPLNKERSGYGQIFIYLVKDVPYSFLVNRHGVCLHY